MPDKRPNSQPRHEKLLLGTPVTTPDGDGHIINYCFRKNTNGGPGCRQYMVRLSDNRIRRYARNKLIVPNYKPTQ